MKSSQPLDPQTFRDPPIEYRGVALWMLNDKLEPDEIVRQLESFKKIGWGAAITRTFNGLRTKYLSEEWMQLLETIVARARELGLKVWFQAGYMPGGIPDLDPALAMVALDRQPRQAPLKEGQKLLAQDERFSYVEQRVDNVLDLLDPAIVADYLDKAYRQPWYDRFGGEFGKTIESIWVDEPHFRPPLLPWGHGFAEKFQKQWGYPIADHLPSLFDQVGDFRQVRHQFYRTALDLFVSGYFVPVGQWCKQYNIKFSGHLMGEDTLHNQIAWTGATMPCYEYMDIPGVDHLTMSLSWPTGYKKFILTPKQCSSAAAQAGRREVLAEIYGVSSNHITFEHRKQIAQWMMILGINYRCYHGAFYSMRGRRKRIYVPHLSHQQPWYLDSRLEADYFARLSYALRQGRPRGGVLLLHNVESMMAIAEIAGLALPHDRSTEPPHIKDFDERFVTLSENLLRAQRDFHYGDETVMARHGSVAADGLRVGEMSYQAVVLPELITIRGTTLDLLMKFAAQGGRIMTAGPLPTRVDGVESPRAKELAAIVTTVESSPAALQKALDAALPAEVEIVAVGGVKAGGGASVTSAGTAATVADIWVLSRQLDGAKLYYLTNTSRTGGLEVEVRIRGAGRLESWGLENGAVTTPPQGQSGDRLVSRLALAPLASQLLLLKESEPAVEVPEVSWRTVRTVNLAGRGRLRRDTANVLPLDICRYRQGDGPWSERLPVIYVQGVLDAAEYRGPVTLEYTFEAETVPPRAALVVEDAAEYRITVNGRPVKYQGLPHYLDRCFHPTDLAGLLRPGVNVIETAIEFRPAAKSQFALASLFEVQTNVELEAVYVIGDFAVRGQVAPRAAQPNCVRYEPRFRLAAEPATSGGDLGADGYPFYAGRMTLTEQVKLTPPAAGQRVVLELDSLGAALVKVRVNGAEAGAILWPPYEIDITALVHDGENEIELELVSTLRNLFGPHHRGSGEPDHTWSTAFLYKRAPEKEHAEERGDHWTDDYFCVNFGPRQPAKISYRAAE